MAEYFHCFSCQRVVPLSEMADQKQCPSCGSPKGEVISQERFNEGFKAGAFFNIDPRTGKRKK